MEQSQKIGAFAIELLNVGSKLINKKGMVAVFNLTDEASALGSLDMAALKAEWAGKPIKPNVEAMVKFMTAKLDLEKKDNQAKIAKFMALLPKACDMVERAISVGDDGKKLIEEGKAIFA